MKGIAKGPGQMRKHVWARY